MPPCQISKVIIHSFAIIIECCNSFVTKIAGQWYFETCDGSARWIISKFWKYRSCLSTALRFWMANWTKAQKNIKEINVNSAFSKSFVVNVKFLSSNWTVRRFTISKFRVSNAFLDVYYQRRWEPHTQSSWKKFCLKKTDFACHWSHSIRRNFSVCNQCEISVQYRCMMIWQSNVEVSGGSSIGVHDHMNL